MNAAFWTKTILASVTMVLSVCCSNNKQQEIDLKDYVSTLNAHDTTSMIFAKFVSEGIDCDQYALRMYLRYADNDSLLRATYLDTDKVFFSVAPYTFVKTGKDEFKLYTQTPGGTILTFLSDSLRFTEVDDSERTTSVHSIPRRIQLGSSYLGGSLHFPRTETLHLGHVDYDCLVGEWSTDDGPIMFWLNPHNFVVKIKYIYKGHYFDVRFLETADHVHSQGRAE